MDSMLERVIAAVQRSQKDSPYYREQLADLTVDSWTSFARIPFSDEQTLRCQGERMACVPPQDIQRVVSFLTSGTEGLAKRIFFSQRDLAATRCYFKEGFESFAAPGQTVLVSYSCKTPNSLGAHVCAACEDAGLRALPCDEAKGLQDALDLCLCEGVAGFAGPPRHALALAHWTRAQGAQLKLAWAMLSGDSVSKAARNEISDIFSCEIFDHYATTEMGFGCALECHAHDGLHIRERDLYLEIIDPHTEKNLPDGQWGEIVFTSLTADAMPLIRYRTGDTGRILLGDCPCGRSERRLDMTVQRSIRLAGHAIDMVALDEELSVIPSLLDYEVRIDETTASLRFGLVLVDAERFSSEEISALEKRLAKAAGEEQMRVSLSIANGGLTGVCCGGKPFPLQKRISLA